MSFLTLCKTTVRAIHLFHHLLVILFKSNPLYLQHSVVPPHHLLQRTSTLVVPHREIDPDRVLERHNHHLRHRDSNALFKEFQAPRTVGSPLGLMRPTPTVPLPQLTIHRIEDAAPIPALRHEIGMVTVIVAMPTIGPMMIIVTALTLTMTITALAALRHVIAQHLVIGIPTTNLRRRGAPTITRLHPPQGPQATKVLCPTTLLQLLHLEYLISPRV